MYEVVKTGTAWEVRDENGLMMARCNLEKDAKEIVAALNLVERAVQDFPGLENGEEEVNGGDLVDLFNECLVFSDGRYRQQAEPAAETTDQVRTDLTALLDYAEKGEFEDFLDHLVENGAEELSEEEVDRLREGTDNALIERECMSPQQTHVYALIHRLRKAVE